MRMLRLLGGAKSTRMRFFLVLKTVCLGLTLSLLIPHQNARALDRDVKAVLITGAYGIVGGTAIGLVSWPMTRQVRSIFMGSSIGLYLGLAAGIYFIQNRHDPDNPLYQPPPGDPPWKQKTPNESSDGYYWEGGDHRLKLPPPLVYLQYEVVRF
jgi:hypothetical protein